MIFIAWVHTPKTHKPSFCTVQMAFKKAVLALAMLYSIQLSLGASEHFVRSTTSTACPAEPCFNLSTYVRNADQYFTSNTEFLLLEGVHYLNALLTLNDVTNVTLSGVDTAATYIVMSAEAGISCANSVGMTLKLIEIQYGQSSAVVFSDSYTVHITGVKFNHDFQRDRSQALTLTHTTASITDCYFTNGHSENGGAININSSDVAFYGSNFFESNTADFSGGAVFAHDSVVAFSGNNTFLANRAGVAGLPTEYTTGGGAVFASQTVLQFDGFSNFTENKPIDEDYSLLGGAIMIVKRSQLHIWKSALFMNNSGYLGAALFSINSSSCLSERVDFTNNTATFQGGGVFAYFSNMSFLEDVIFANNTSGHDGGAIYIQSSILKYLGNVTFIGNSAISRGGYGGGVYAVDSTVTISESIDFIENTARRGGGVGFEGVSQLVLQSPVTVNFLRNNAEEYGGGIYFHDSTTTYGIECRNISVEAANNCFFKVDAANSSSLDIHLNFMQNYAVSATAINGGALDFCRVQVNDVRTDSSGFSGMCQHLETSKKFRISHPDLQVFASAIMEWPIVPEVPEQYQLSEGGLSICR